MHRDGSGKKIPDIDTTRAQWRAAGRTVSTYPNKGEFNAFVEDFGTITHTGENGEQLRRHATVKAHTRGGSPKIVHNCTITGTPGVGPPIWTYYPDSDHDEMLERRLNPITVS